MKYTNVVKLIHFDSSFKNVFIILNPYLLSINSEYKTYLSPWNNTEYTKKLI